MFQNLTELHLYLFIERMKHTVNACLMPRHQTPRLHIRRDRQRPYFRCKNESNFGRLRPKSISRKRRAALVRKPTKRTPFFKLKTRKLEKKLKIYFYFLDKDAEFQKKSEKIKK
jgi:hypothetical protein